ncbi:glutamate racemase [Campylobacter hyointestinalis]|uniref:Glutamate racemase n=1 Tax=Campylobacter hyointestinalis subsp. lawsonii TaxID=91353 RepID=A0AAV6EIF1_CAMHY|nr:glutamate racemase [Campylobacter hyointestinalis]KAB0612528.1 glutamate racemase [Campylobacter hyointestinalis subsp. lawsonii]QKF68983.1 glutamate racemase [Campylobacter hyointestinalis subsp. lawsonii]RAZ27671.1 glutamate racemase [Campylobacter hyointestinalis subsp. lawsonii]
MKIAIFDSGFGGLSLLNEALKRFSGVEFIYFADNENAPYGTKSKDEIIRLCLNCTMFLTKFNIDMIVIACNTATSAAITELRSSFSVPIIGMEPAIKLGANAGGDILVVATPATINGNKLSDLIHKVNLESKTHLLALPKLVEFAQNMEFNSEEILKYLKDEIYKFDLSNIDLLVLGCTHFNYFKDSFRAILPDKIGIIDGINGTINQMIRRLGGISKFGDKNSIRYISSTKNLDIKEIEPYLKRLDIMREIN